MKTNELNLRSSVGETPKKKPIYKKYQPHYLIQDFKVMERISHLSHSDHAIQIAALDLNGTHAIKGLYSCAPQDLNLSHRRKDDS